MITVKDLAEKDKVRRNVKKEIYTSILGQFSRRIKARFDLGDKKTTLSVPLFLVGYPRYDLAQAVRYLGRQLLRSGYRVTMVSPVSFEVSWEKLKEQEPVVEETVEPEFSFPSLMNLKKTADRYTAKLKNTSH
jgi:hypothetical protein